MFPDAALPLVGKRASSAFRIISNRPRFTCRSLQSLLQQLYGARDGGVSPWSSDTSIFVTMIRLTPTFPKRCDFPAGKAACSSLGHSVGAAQGGVKDWATRICCLGWWSEHNGKIVTSCSKCNSGAPTCLCPSVSSVGNTRAMRKRILSSSILRIRLTNPVLPQSNWNVPSGQYL